MNRGIEFVKGHGTENDFVLIPDPDGRLDLTSSRVAALCDRHRGLGADGVLRVVRGAHVVDPPPGTDPDGWFMDYRNADGSVAEMCGNGVRVFAHYLEVAGLVDTRRFAVGSRSGPRAVSVDDTGVAVAMGVPRVDGATTVTVGGSAVRAVAVDVGNPHAVCDLAGTGLDLAALDLSVPPGYDGAVFPHGVNVEFVEVRSAEVVRMRVHERGVGETRSCGTGTVAVVAAVLAGRGDRTGELTVEVPGGRVRVRVDTDDSLLHGPAELVASGTLDRDWWDAH